MTLPQGHGLTSSRRTPKRSDEHGAFQRLSVSPLYGLTRFTWLRTGRIDLSLTGSGRLS